jgi:hypothetical protein
LPPDQPALLVIDEDMNWKLARELRRRGMIAKAVKELGLHGLKDGALIKALAELNERCVLVTYDGKMPFSHRAQLDHFGTTLAVVGRRTKRDGLNEDELYRDVVHRNAHRMAIQPQSTSYRYTRTRRVLL